MKPIQPARPGNLDPIADKLLEKLRGFPEAANVVIGGGVALNCYAPPRLTHDVDAWWSQDSGAADRASTLTRIRAIAEEVAASAGLVVVERPRAASEVVSIELQANRRTVFSFQIAPRDIELEPPTVECSPFAPVPIEAFADNLGAKMTALVSRGAPRDFQDVFTVVRAQIASPEELWALYAAKNPGSDLAIAKAQVAQRLAEIELRRPLPSLDLKSRSAAEELRAWVRETFIGQPFAIPAEKPDAEP
jgi:hypothetical protein